MTPQPDKASELARQAQPEVAPARRRCGACGVEYALHAIQDRAHIFVEPAPAAQPEAGELRSCICRNVDTDSPCPIHDPHTLEEAWEEIEAYNCDVSQPSSVTSETAAKGAGVTASASAAPAEPLSAEQWHDALLSDFKYAEKHKKGEAWLIMTIVQRIGVNARSVREQAEHSGNLIYGWEKARAERLEAELARVTAEREALTNKVARLCEEFEMQRQARVGAELERDQAREALRTGAELVAKLKAARTAWHEDFGVPIP